MSHPQVAQQENLQSRWDSGNLIISRPAGGPSYGEPIIIQTHVDMVCEKHADLVHDFQRDGSLSK